jgi:hypothetical protein
MNKRFASTRALRVIGLASLVFLALLGGCASKGAKTAEGPKVPPSQITVYESTELLHSQYTLVQHLWIDSWRSNWSFPKFSTEAEGLEAMKRAASDAGANALLHAICVNGATKASESAVLYCYGDAIKVN